MLAVAEDRCHTMLELEPGASTYVGVAANEATYSARRTSSETSACFGTAANEATYSGRCCSAVEVAQGLTLYEEYHPFGTSSYRAADSGIEVSPKRYRYIGKERDEETGLYHCGARYLAGWLGRWTAADPIGLGDGVNRYAYVRGNPIKLSDPSGMAPPEQQQEIRILRPEEFPRDKAIEIGPGGKVEFRDLTPAEIEQGRAEVEQKNREIREGIYESLANPRETPRQRERRQRDAAIKAKQEAGEPLFPAQGTGQAPGRAANTDEYGNYSPYLQAVNETQAMYGPDAGPGPGGPTDPLINPIVQQGVLPAKVFGAFIGAGLQKGGFLRGPGGKAPGGGGQTVQQADDLLHGTGPQSGVIEASSRVKSTAQLRNFDPRPNPSYGGERTVEFVYDPATKRFAVGKAQGAGSPHQKLANAINPDYDPRQVVGGTFSRGKSGEILTNEYSGHFGENWTDAMRAEFVEFLESATGQRVVHETWPGRR